MSLKKMHFSFYVGVSKPASDLLLLLASFYHDLILNTEAVRGSSPAVRALLSSALFPAGL